MKSSSCQAMGLSTSSRHAQILRTRLGAAAALCTALCASSVAMAAPPVANPDTYTTTFDQGLTVSAAQGLLANDSDPDQDAIIVIPPGVVLGEAGQEPGQLTFPLGCEVDSEGNIYVTNNFTPRVEKLDANGNPLLSFELEAGVGIALDIDNNVLVTRGPFVYRFAPDGQLLERFGDQHLTDAWGLTVDLDGNIYVADHGSRRIVKFDPAGEMIFDFGGPGSDPGLFGSLGDVAVDPEGNIYVAEYNGHRIQKFDANGENPLVIGGFGTAPGEFQTVSGIAVDSQGNIIVTETDNHRVQILDSEGFPLSIIGARGSARGQFLFPWGVAVDAEDNIYVADKNNSRVQRFNRSRMPQRGILGLQPDGSFIYTPEFGFEGQQTFQYAVTDGTGESQTVNVTIDVRSPAPVLTSPGGQNSVDGQDVSLALQAADPNNAPLLWSAAGLPPGLSLNPNTGEISGTLADDASLASPYIVQLQVTNGRFIDDTLFVWMVGSSNRAPVLTSPGTQRSVEGDNVNLAVSASDPDGDPLSFAITGLPAGLSFSAQTGQITGSITPGAAQSSPHLVRVQVSDGQAAATSEFIWTVTPQPVVNQAPTLNNPGTITSTEGDNINLGLLGSDPEGGPLSYAARRLPNGLAIGAATGVISGVVQPGAAQLSPFLVQVDVSDGVNTTTEAFLWQINPFQRPNRAPVVLNPGTQRADEGQGLSLTIQTGDPDNDPLSVAVTGLPSGLSFEPQNRVIQGAVAPGAALSSPFLVQIEVTDGQLSAQTSFLWVIGQAQNVNQAPTLQSPGTQASTEGDAVGLVIQASDPENTPLSFTAQGLPNGLAIEPTTGRIAGTVVPGASLNSPHLVQVVVSDGSLQSAVEFLWVVDAVEVVNFAPEVSAPDTQRSEEGARVSLDVTATDPNADVLSFEALGLPDGLAIDAQTGAISGVVAQGAHLNSPFLVQVDVHDGQLTTQVSFLWVISPVEIPNLAPNLTEPANQRSLQGDVVDLRLEAVDPEGAALTFTVRGLPGGLTIDAQTGAITGTVAQDAAASSPYLVRAEVSDGQLSAEVSFLWVIRSVVDVNEPPSLVEPGNQSSQEGDVVELALGAQDPEGGALVFGATGLPSGLSIDESTGVIGGTVAQDAADQSPYLVQVVVSDGELGAEVSFLWVVERPVNQAPVVENPGNQTNLEGEMVAVQVVGSDPEGAQLVWEAQGLPAGLSINAEGLIEGQIEASASASSPHLVEVSATDGVSSARAVFLWNVAGEADVPGLEVTLGGPFVVEEGQSIVLVGGANAQGVTFSWDLNGDGQCDDAMGPNADFEAIDGPATLPVKLCADNGTQSASADSLVLVTNQAPFIVSVPQASLLQGSDYVYEVLADDQGEDTLSVALSSAPDGAELDGNTLRWTPTAAQLAQDSFALSIEVCDEDGDCDAQAWTVRLEAPQTPNTSSPTNGGCSTAPGAPNKPSAPLLLMVVVLCLGTLRQGVGRP